MKPRPEHRSQPREAAAPAVAPTRKRQTLAELRELQRLAASVIMRPLGRGMRTQSTWDDGRATADVAASFVRPNDRLTSFERIEIYNRQYWFRLIDVLYEDYPGLRAVVGGKRFDLLVRAYLAKYPSRSYTLRNLGSRLTQFLDEEPQWAGPRLAMARDMARFEWAQTVAFDGPAEPILSVDDLLGADPTKLRLGLQPYLTLLEMGYPLDEFSIALKRRASRGDASNAVDGAEHVVEETSLRLPRKERVYVAVHRLDLTLYYKRLERDGFVLLTALREGATLADACGVAVDQMKPRDGDPGKRIQSLFRNWSELGWFCRRK